MTSGRVEVITSVQRRRRWSISEKQQLLAASLEPERACRFWRGKRGSTPASYTAGGANCGHRRR